MIARPFLQALLLNSKHLVTTYAYTALILPVTFRCSWPLLSLTQRLPQSRSYATEQSQGSRCYEFRNAPLNTFGRYKSLCIAAPPNSKPDFS